MEDMIERIVEMDKKARDVTEEIQKERLSLEQEIVLLKKSIRDKYFGRAQKRLNKNKSLEEEHTKHLIQEINERETGVIEKLDEIYAKNNQLWIKALYDKVISF